MTYLVDEIELDFETDGDPIPEQTQRLIAEGCIGAWEADDPDDLVEEITAATGWCVRNIDYRLALR